MQITHLLARVTGLLSDIELQPSNQQDMQRLLADMYIGDVLEGIAKSRKDRATKALRQQFADRLANPMPLTTLVTVAPFELLAKVDNPRNSFDVDGFIKTVAEKYKLSAGELHNIAANSTKQSAAPVSLRIALAGGNDQ